MNILPIIANQSKTKKNAIQGKNPKLSESIAIETTFFAYLGLHCSFSLQTDQE
jgi:hypothetical protein